MSQESERIEELHQQAMTKPKAERAAFLAEACTSDETLRRFTREAERPIGN